MTDLKLNENSNFNVVLDTKATKVCGPGKMQCYRMAENEFYIGEYRVGCNCLPSCTTLTYQGYQTTSDYDLVSTISKSIFRKDFNLEK